jgi:predicted nucleic acid-binding protein
MATTRYLFVDTSALVKYVHAEAGSDRVIDPKWRFVVADDRLYDVALEEGITAIHPVRGSG